MANDAPSHSSAAGLQHHAAGLFSLILSLRESHAYGQEDQLRARLRDYLQQFERSSLASGLDAQDVADAKVALVAFIDETILKSSWEHVESWRRKTLGLELLGHILAGQKFFEGLTRARHVGPAKRDLLEIYHLCLALGFEGEYGIRARGQLRPLIEELQRELGLPEQMQKDIRLAPNGKPRDIPIFREKDTFPFRRICLIAAGGLLALWIVLAIILHSAGGGKIVNVNGLG